MSSKLALLVLLPFTLDPAHAQCALDGAGPPQPHLTGFALCSTVWDPDGAGPLPQRLVVGGSYLLAGTQVSGSERRVMTWDGSTWESLGTGPGNNIAGGVSSLITFNGELIAGGSFTSAGGPNYIARWDGSAWQSLGTGFPTKVGQMALWNGNLVVAGFTGSGTTSSPVLGVWNGTTWSTLPAPPALDTPSAMVSFKGELMVAGAQHLPLMTQGVLERWNGSSWATTITTSGGIASMAVRVNLAVGGSDTLIVGGLFTNLGGTAVTNVARTNGAPSFAWSSIGGGLSSPCASLLVQNAGLNYTVIALTTSSMAPVMRYTTQSGTWTSIGGPSSSDIVLYAGSYHALLASGAGPHCERYNGSQWLPVLGPGIDGFVNAATRSGNDTVIGGTFAKISGVAMNGIARWDGSTFTPLGTGMVGSSVDALVTLDNGDIVAGGNFAGAGGVAVNHVARWNGSTWSAMGNGFDAPVHALCQMPNGDVIAGGSFTQEVGAPVLCSHVARWNGSSWSPMDFGMNDDVLALTVRSDGTLIAGGRFTQTMSTMFSLYHVARWTGTQWAGLGAGMNAPVHGLAARPNGDVVAVGEFTQASLQNVDRIARWNGSSWVSMGASSVAPGAVRAVHALANGDILAGRGFHLPSSPWAGISRWNGSTWSDFGSFALLDPYPSTPEFRTIVQGADGALVVGGVFSEADFTMAWSLASLRSTCMPTAASYGSGCSSASGPLSITADTLPWIGSAFRATTTGVAANSICLGIIGLSQLSIPLPALLPEGQPGCSLLVSLDMVLTLAPGPGTASSSFALANDPSLIGVPFFEQTIPFELDLAGALTAVRGSNALALVIGTL